MAKRKSGQLTEALDLPLPVVLDLLRGDSLTLDQVITAARLSALDTATFRDLYETPADWLHALLERHDPSAAFADALRQINGETADDLLRGAVRQVIATAGQNRLYLTLAALEAERYQGNTLNTLIGGLLPVANELLDRLNQTGEIRPLPDWMIARVLASALIGFVASESALPQGLQWAARLLPPRIWADGLTDILLYGILEDKS